MTRWDSSRCALLVLVVAGVLRAASAAMASEMSQFAPVLSLCKLQAPRPSREQKDLTKPFQNNYFKVTDGKFMSFVAKDRPHRAELRQLEEWRTGTRVARRAVATLKIDMPQSKMEEITFLQIHSHDAPLVRAAWMRYEEKDGAVYEDYLWLVIRTGLGSRDVLDIPIASRPNRLFNFEIKVQKNTMSVYMNRNLVHKMNVGYWRKYDSYFKSGVYIQHGRGPAKIDFAAMNFVVGGSGKSRNRGPRKAFGNPRRSFAGKGKKCTRVRCEKGLVCVHHAGSKHCKMSIPRGGKCDSKWRVCARGYKCAGTAGNRRCMRKSAMKRDAKEEEEKGDGKNYEQLDMEDFENEDMREEPASKRPDPECNTGTKTRRVCCPAVCGGRCGGSGCYKWGPNKICCQNHIRRRIKTLCTQSGPPCVLAR